jgi:hypothetical protein
MKITNDELSTLVGYEVGRELRLMILRETKETGKDIREVASQYNLPLLVIPDADGRFLYEGKMITVKEWELCNPLLQYGKLIVIKS